MRIPAISLACAALLQPCFCQAGGGEVAAAAPALQGEKMTVVKAAGQLQQSVEAAPKPEEAAVQASRSLVLELDPGQSLNFAAELVNIANNQTNAASQTAFYAAAESAYGDVILRSQGMDKMLASNNLAALYLRQGKAGEAVKTLSAVTPQEMGKLDDSAKSRLLYNYGSALQASGSVDQALTSYRDAFESDDAFILPAKKGLALALQQPGTASSLMTLNTISSRLIGRGDLGDLGATLDEALRAEWQIDPRGASAFVDLFVDYLIARKVEPPEFMEHWKPLVEGSPILAEASAKRRLADVDRIYVAHLDDMLDRQRVREQFDAGRLAPGRFTALVKLAAEGYLRTGDLDQALQRYFVAWTAGRDIEGALYAANLLLTNATTIDPDGRVLDRFIGAIFRGKGEAYLGEDWENILRCHTVLGTIYWRKQQWGDSYDPRSAIFQLENGVRARQHLEEKSGVRRPTPGLFLKLADAYQATHQMNKAIEAYLSAAEDAYALRQDKNAREYVRAASVMDRSVGGLHRGQIEELERKLAGSRPSA